ncbi:MAG: hypothetical protein AAFX08_01050 [Pseudomonadota bacterium]
MFERLSTDAQLHALLVRAIRHYLDGFQWGDRWRSDDFDETRRAEEPSLRRGGRFKLRFAAVAIRRNVAAATSKQFVRKGEAS